MFIICLILINTSFASAKTLGNETGLKIPRFVSLKSDNSNLRIGPSENYPVKIKYIVANMPVEIIDEYKNWRKIIDYEENEGWIHKNLIKGKRFAIVNTPYENGLQVFNKPKGSNIGKIGKKNILEIKTCLINWCKIEYKKNKGWVNKLNLWGVYEKEIINIPFYQTIINLIWRINLNFLYSGWNDRIQTYE
jgi:SH3-like domain-containing protein|tara:strand:- start:68 stop:643 length:576 start_codon:yes stop_codon:yes gene_type:complete